MPVHEELPIRHHQQEGDFMCGAACAQMVLDGVGASLPDQAGLDTDISNHNLIENGWAAAPDGLHWAVNNGVPASFPKSFHLFGLGSKDAVSRAIVWSIHNKVPAIALISGRSHWIVMRGYEASAAPSGPADASYTITSWDINNSYPPVPSAPPPPHSGSDPCGSGGEYGLADEHISYGHWLSAYMTGVPTGSHWEGKFLAIANADLAPTGPGVFVAAPRRFDGERILSPGQAREMAVAGLEEYGLYQRETWRKSLTRTKAAAPFLVQRLDRRDTFYYIVPMQGARKAAPVLVCVDARFGNYQQAARIIGRRGGDALRGLDFDPRHALDRVIGQELDLGRHGRLRVRKEAFSLYPTLVWRPCRESMSPYVPFFMLTVGDRRIYVRVDGQVFARLHLHDRGI